MAEQPAQNPDPVTTPLYGAPITMTAPWHNAPGTGESEIAEPAEYQAYGTDQDGRPVAKVLKPPPATRSRRGRQAQTKTGTGTVPEDGSGGG